MNTSGDLYSDSQALNPLAYGSSGGAAQNFRFDYIFTGVQTVYLRIQNLSNFGAINKVKISCTHSHSYNHSYSLLIHIDTLLTVRAEKSIQEGHVVSSNNINICLLCGGYADRGFVV